MGIGRHRSRTPHARTEAAAASDEAAPPRMENPFEMFMASRSGKKFSKKSREALGKELRYDKCTKEQQQLLDESRAAEWRNWMSYKSVKPLNTAEASELIAAGSEPVPTPWIELDKNKALRVPGGPPVPHEYEEPYGFEATWKTQVPGQTRLRAHYWHTTSYWATQPVRVSHWG